MIIVTGATGFVGRRVVKLLANKYNTKEILCLVRDLNTPVEKSGREIIRKLGIKMKSVDLVTGQGLNHFPSFPKLIIHLAAMTDTSVSDQRCNDLGVINLLKAIGPLGPKSHFIHISTMVAMSGRIDCSRPFDENDTLQPTNEYGRSKKRGEDFLVSQCKLNKFKLTILRPNTIYGSDMRPDSLFDFLKKLIRKHSIFAHLNWPGLSSLVHVDDVAKAILWASQRSPKSGKAEVFLLHGQHLTLAQMSELMHKKLDLDYLQINLPIGFWKVCAKARFWIPFLEKLLPPAIYNLFWRFGIIIDNVTYCKATKLSRIFPSWKPKLLENTINEVV